MQTFISINRENRIARIREGIRFLLSHFEGRQQLFPRKMSTALSLGKQFTIYTEEQILNECIKANFVDCRLNAYPILLDDDEYATTTQAPNVILIDLDLSTNKNHEKNLLQLNKILSKIIKRINMVLDGANPTVLWTGNGYHVYTLLEVRPLELFSELRELSKEPSKEFLKFAEITFSNHKSDPKHNPAFKSYLLRIPYTFNSKCIDNGKDSEVKIVQRFDMSKIPTINTSLLREFRLYLADLDVKNKKVALARRQVITIERKSNFPFSAPAIPQYYKWLEKLLQTPIPDHRKHALELGLAPYLIVIKQLSTDESYALIKDWAFKCDSVKSLQPSLNNFLDCRTKTTINKSYQNGIPPIKRETVMRNYPFWYNDFKQWKLFDY